MKKYILLLVGIVSLTTFFPLKSLAQENAETGMIKGMIMGSKSKNALAGAAIILGRITSDGECKLQADLIVTTDESGRFSFFAVPSGRYVLLYDPLGKAIPTWKTINGLTVNYKQGRPMKLGSFMTKEFYETFGGSGGIVVKKGTTAKMFDGKLTSIDGSFASEKYGLTIDFHEGKPLTIEVNQGKTVEIEINAYGL